MSGATAAPPAGAGAERLGSYAPRVEARLAEWQAGRASTRIWEKDPSFWPAADPNDVATRLGWLSLPSGSERLVPEAMELAHEVRTEGFRRVVLLGMGGSSLAPETLARAFGLRPGWPELRVLDSTHPAAVARTVSEGDLSQTLFIVSSKSGTTLEPNALFAYFWDRAVRLRPEAGAQFVAITDPGTPLEALARQHGFRRCFLAPSDVGGRYSALTPFGLVPAALVGIDVEGLLANAQAMAARCGPGQAAATHPGLRLGAILGEIGRAGRDKVILVPSRSIESLPPWLEQLIAESLGKRGTGLVPVTGEVDPLDPMGAADRIVVELRGTGDTGASDPPAGDATPRVVVEIPGTVDIAGEFFRWEFAIAAVGAVLGIDPFDQPDVEFAKELARQAMKSPAPSADPTPAAVPVEVADRDRIRARLAEWCGRARPGDYAAVQAFLDPTEPVRQGVRELAYALRRRLRLATTVGFGPRFQHSTGQLHKGGPPTGLFLQFIDEPTVDVEVPGMSLSFGRIIRSQADGDAQALLQRGRRLLRVQLGRDALAGLEHVRREIASR